MAELKLGAGRHHAVGAVDQRDLDLGRAGRDAKLLERARDVEPIALLLARGRGGERLRREDREAADFDRAPPGRLSRTTPPILPAAGLRNALTTTSSIAMPLLSARGIETAIRAGARAVAVCWASARQGIDRATTMRLSAATVLIVQRASLDFSVRFININITRSRLKNGDFHAARPDHAGGLVGVAADRHQLDHDLVAAQVPGAAQARQRRRQVD